MASVFEAHPARMIILRATVLLCGATGMVLELVGSRLLAPYFGNGLFVWTALIGIMLGFMSLGNYLGGRLADRHLTVSVLYWILVASSIGIALVSFIEPLILPPLSAGLSVRIASVVSAIALFAIPCTALGMVTPYSVRYAIQSLVHSGATVGSLFALGTLGSIIGTFLGGFYLIAAVGSHALIAYLSIVPLVLAVPFIKRGSRRYHLGGAAVAVVLIGLSFATQASALDRLSDAFGAGLTVTSAFDTAYDRYFIAESVEPATGRPVRYLARDFESAESAVYADTGEPLIFDYYEYYDLTLAAASNVGDGLRSTLLVGGGTFSYPRHQVAEYASSTSDVVEIDPALVDVARAHFALADDDRIAIYTEDARTFLNRASQPSGRAGESRRGSYDVVLIDAFKSANSIPYQLTTAETMRACLEVLDDDGFLVMNIIASPGGAGSQFVSAEYATIASIFPQVNLYAVQDTGRSDVVQNISIVATKAPATAFSLTEVLANISPDLSSRQLNPSDLPAGFVLTDDRAPADQLLQGI